MAERDTDKVLIDALQQIAFDCEEIARDVTASAGERAAWRAVARIARAALERYKDATTGKHHA